MQHWAEPIQKLILLPMLFWASSAVIIMHCKRAKLEPPDWVRNVFHEIRPFYFAMTLVFDVCTVLDGKDSALWDALGIASFTIYWFLLKDVDDDDRWKKRKEKAVGVVKSLGHRLVIVNAGA